MQSAKSEERFLNFLSTKATVGLGRSLNRKRFSKRRAKSRPQTARNLFHRTLHVIIRRRIDVRMSAPEKMPLSAELLKYGSFGFEAVNTTSTWNTYTYLSYLV